MVMYLAGLQGIPEELDEASAVDGASTFRRFRKITLPLLAPAITVSVTLSTIYGLGVFDQVFALTGGGPVDASETLATQIYKQTFAFGRFGYGTALSLVLTVLITVLAVAQLVDPARAGEAALDGRRYTGWTFLRELTLLVVAIIWMIPFYFLVIVAVKPDVEALQSPLIVPGRAAPRQLQHRVARRARSAARS